MDKRPDPWWPGTVNHELQDWLNEFIPEHNLAACMGFVTLEIPDREDFRTLLKLRWNLF
jgi:hypothetical protein